MRIKFYAYKIFPGSKEMSDLYRAVDIVCDTVKTVVKVFNGKAIYVGTGEESFQYDDVVEFQELSNDHKVAILAAYPFASVFTR